MCVWQCRDGDWHRSLFHMWRKHVYTKVCVRCGASKGRVF